MASELLKRSEVKEADTWNVKDMYPTTEAWENELKIITGIVDKIASYEGNVTATAENLLIVLEQKADCGNPQNERTLPLSREGKAACNDG